eukprot:TRINITY_DN4492_c0_g1_i4.p1 TRINITY_DN4492_c0_g1~~TRINITY_DN4492_c0_g1_i4.p1  ORF type:complete len:249 (+),score=73.26 TRINITY_DN4492_c0_g1_i4:36-782(+)
MAKGKKRTRNSEKQSESPKKRRKVDEDSEESFSFEEDSSERSDNSNKPSSTDLSSSVDDFAAGKLEIKLDDATEKKLKKKVRKRKTEVSENAGKMDEGVIYLGHIPYGFFEAQMREYFTQFGEISRLRLSRNKRTGRSKHYCFIQFFDPFVAQVVADTMDGYIMYERALVCKLIPPEKVHPNLFKGANKKYVPKRTRLEHIAKRNAEKTEEQKQKSQTRLLKKEERKRRKLAELGIDYEFPGFVCKHY